MKRKNNTTKKRNEYKNASRYIVYLLKCVLNQLEFKNLPVDFQGKFLVEESYYETNGKKHASPHI